MTGIFINYRKDDDAFAAPLVDTRLREVFGADKVFFDSRSLEAACDFPPELWRRLKQSTVLVVLIGPRWLTLADEAGERRIDNRQDFVRREIRRALKRHLAVLPVLLDGAMLPHPSELPPDIAALGTRQYQQLRSSHTDHDLDLLVAVLARLVPTGSGGGAVEAGRPAAAPGRHSAVQITGRDQRFDGPVVGGDLYGGVNGG